MSTLNLYIFQIEIETTVVKLKFVLQIETPIGVFKSMEIQQQPKMG